MSITDGLTAALTIITGIYAYLTFRILKANEHAVAAMQEQAEQANRPYVVVAPFLKPHSIVIYLRITNSGKTAVGGAQEARKVGGWVDNATAFLATSGLILAAR